MVRSRFISPVRGPTKTRCTIFSGVLQLPRRHPGYVVKDSVRRVRELSVVLRSYAANIVEQIHESSEVSSEFREKFLDVFAPKSLYVFARWHRSVLVLDETNAVPSQHLSRSVYLDLCDQL